VKVFIQRSRDGLFLTADDGWAGQEAALDFKNCTPAIDFCVESSLTNVRLWLSFDDPKYDFPVEVFRAETRVLVKYNKELRETGRILLEQMDQIGAEAKERKKQRPFKPKAVGDRDQQTA
jgi:hypothetical protein